MPLLGRSLAALAGATVGAAVLGVAVGIPAAAQADPAQYTPPSPSCWSATIAPGTILDHAIAAGTFDNAVGLQLSVNGVASAPTVAVFGASQLAQSVLSNSSGGAQISLNFGATTSGVYNVTLAQSGTQNVSCGVVDVVKRTDPSAAPLAATGTRVSYGTIWGAGGAVILGALLTFVVGARRRARDAHGSTKS